MLLNYTDLDNLRKIGKDLDGDDCYYFDLGFIRINLYSYAGDQHPIKSWGPIKDMSINVTIQDDKKYLNSLEIIDFGKKDHKFAIFEHMKEDMDLLYARVTFRNVKAERLLAVLNNAHRFGLLRYNKVDSVKCRACKNYELMAEPDGLSDNLFTCWRCKVHPFRKSVGVAADEAALWERIYKTKINNEF